MPEPIRGINNLSLPNCCRESLRGHHAVEARAAHPQPSVGGGSSRNPPCPGEARSTRAERVGGRGGVRACTERPGGAVGTDR